MESCPPETRMAQDLTQPSLVKGFADLSGMTTLFRTSVIALDDSKAMKLPESVDAFRALLQSQQAYPNPTTQAAIDRAIQLTAKDFCIQTNLQKAFLDYLLIQGQTPNVAKTDDQKSVLAKAKELRDLIGKFHAIALEFYRQEIKKVKAFENVAAGGSSLLSTVGSVRLMDVVELPPTISGFQNQRPPSAAKTLEGFQRIMDGLAKNANLETRQAMVEQTQEKNKNMQSLITLQGFLNLVAVGLLFYVASKK